MAKAMRDLIFACALGSLVLSVQPGVALAQTDVSAAREAYQRATAEFGLGNYAIAATEYEKAFRFKPDPALLFNAAQAYRLAENKPRALQLYRNYLRLFPDGVAVNEARKHVDTLEAASPAQTSVAATPGAPATVVPTAPAATEVGKTDATLVDSAPADETPSLLASPWFWAGAAAVAIAVTVVVVVASGSEPENPDATWGRVDVK